MASGTPCTASDLDQRGTISLPVLSREHNPRGTVRRSRSGRRRAIVLATVQLLIIGHIVLWLLSRKYGWFGGRTITPVEPSESMEFAKDGVVNAGLIFFALTLVSTLIMGRWFCGWACHVVLLQDLCSWIMKKMGVRPKPFRSRLLIYVPLLLALYMFVWPAFYRLAVAPWVQPDLKWPGVSTQFTTADFWQNFAGPLVAIPFLLICGFAAVYFLGSKGFCTYGCPYGGFFAPLDEFAVGRIRVTDACEQCGHCTAVCTSNVRVHEEVRAYGMVVDPGCMKCLDCVSVCPNDALYFGFGRPAQLKKLRVKKTPRRIYDLTWPEEIGLAIVFLLSFLSVRGVYALVPMLMAAGVAGVVTFGAWKLWRLIRDANVRFHQFQLQYHGRLKLPGVVFGGLVVIVLALTAHSGLVNALEGGGVLAERRAARLVSAPAQPADADKAVARAMGFFRLASGIGDGGIGLAGNPRIDLRLVRLHWHRGDLGEAERYLARAIKRSRPNQVRSRDLARIVRAQGREAEALAYAEGVLAEHPDFAQLRDDVALWLAETGQLEAAIQLCRRGVEHDPQSVVSMYRLSLLLLHVDRADEAVDVLKRLTAVDPENPAALSALAYAWEELGQIDDALAAMTRAVILAPDDPQLNAQVAALQEKLKWSEEVPE